MRLRALSQRSYLNVEMQGFPRRAAFHLMINDGGVLTLRVYDSGDELDEGDVAPCGSVMKETGSTFIFLAQDLWALLHQVLQESQVTPLSQLHGHIEQVSHHVLMIVRIYNNITWFALNYDI